MRTLSGNLAVIGLIQRVTRARVSVADEEVARVGRGLLLLLGVGKGDDESIALRLAERVLGYRIFPDEEGRMNRSLLDVRGEILIVSQFTLVADTRKGTRAGFSTAAHPADGERLYRCFVEEVRRRTEGLGMGVAEGRFGADMQVELTNDGPVTFWLEVSPVIDKRAETPAGKEN